MPPHRPIRGRRRRQLGLALLTTGLLLAITFAASARWWFGYSSRTWVADLGDGTLYTVPIEPNHWSEPLRGWHGGDNARYSAAGRTSAFTWTWWTWGERSGTWEKGQAHTVWPLAPLLMLAGASLFWPGYRSARRVRQNQCPRCAYSRAGLDPDAPCPECGRVVSG